MRGSEAALDAEMVASSVRGTRIVAAKDYFQGIMSTALAEDELLAEVRLPLLPPGTRTGFQEFNRRAGDFAIAMAVVAYRIDGGAMADARIAVGGAEASPRRIAEAEQVLNGKTPGAEAFVAAADAAAKALDPIEDNRNTGDLSPRRGAYDGPQSAGTGRADERGNPRHQMDRPVGRAAGGPAADHRPRRVRG